MDKKNYIEPNPEDIENFWENQKIAVEELETEAGMLKREFQKILDGKRELCNCPKCQCYKCKFRNLNCVRKAIVVSPCVYRIVDEWICKDCKIIWKENLGTQDFLTERLRLQIIQKSDPPKLLKPRFKKQRNFFKD